jgi:hypothetical protein
MIKIDKVIKAEIEETIGKSIPDTQSKEFEMFYEWLVKEHPDLARKLEQSLEVTEPYPEEAARKQAQRREGIANTLQRMFYKQVWGKKVLNRRALSLTIFFLIFGVMMASWSLTFFRKPSRVEIAEEPAQPVQTPVDQANAAPTETTPSNDTNLLIVPEVQVNNPSPVEELQEDSPLVVPDITDAVPPQTLPQEVSPSPLQPPPIPQGLEMIEEEHEPIPQTAVLVTDEVATPMPEFSVKAFKTLELAIEPVMIGSSEAIVAEQQPVLAFTVGEVVLPETSVITGADVPSDTDNSTNSAVASTGTELTTSSVLAFGAENTPVQSSVEIELPRASVAEGVKTDTPPASLEPTETNVERVPPPTTNADDGGLLETNLFNGNESDLLKPGMLIPATLQKDIIVTEGETRQVLADAEEGWCREENCPSLRWLGTATLSESGRLDVVFEEAVLDGEVIELSGVAYGADNAEGLPAHLADTTPTLLADLLRAGAGGVTDYVEAEANRETVTQDGDSTITDTNVPGLLEFILGRAAGTLQVPEGETSVIRLAAVEKGTRLEVLYLER